MHILKTKSVAGCWFSVQSVYTSKEHGELTFSASFIRRILHFANRQAMCRHEICNTHGFNIPGSKTKQYKSLFFVRTVADWNKLEDTVVTADSVNAFSSAACRVLLKGLPPTHRQPKQQQNVASF